MPRPQAPKPAAQQQMPAPSQPAAAPTVGGNRPSGLEAALQQFRGGRR